ncbi:MAG: hypothetical protein NC299_13845 [Lachnospiraceae bacterium]|nr:hypothetical protein [Ruminococcus sp.]MCM1276418.1 hypothetical protein [Lachnospiraceae bacterium]
MNKANLNAILNQYVERFDELNAPLPGNDEGYKWRAESCFKEHWDIDAANFPDMFREAMKETSNLIDNKTVQPIGGISMLLKQESEIEFVRECFRELFSEDDNDLNKRQERIELFAEKINERIDKYAPSSWKYPQAINNVIYYVNLWKPESNYIFKSTEAVDWANCIEFGDDFGSGQTFSLAVYYRMCDELLAELPKYDELMRLHGERFAREARNFDDKLHILVYDIIYCAYHYGFYRNVDVRKYSTKERIKVAQRQAERDELTSRITEKEEQLRVVEENAIELPDITGDTVKHKLFGAGTVAVCKDGLLIVDFSTQQKKFVYPTAFSGGFLKHEGEDILDIVNKATEQASRISALKSEIADLQNRLSKM